MSRIMEFNDLNKNNKELTEIKKLVLKQVSRSRYQIINEFVEVKVKYQDELYTVRLSNELSIYELRNMIYGMVNGEDSTYFFSSNKIINDGIVQGKSLCETLQEYKDNTVKCGKDIKDKWYKLYSNSKIEDPLRDLYGALWIDYDKQLEKNDYIYDENGVNGLWAFKRNVLPKVLNEQCFNRYGNKLLLVGPMENEYYFFDDKEIIGDKYKVLKQFDLSNISDICELMEIEKSEIRKEYVDQINVLKKIYYDEQQEKNNNIDLLNSMYKRDRVLKKIIALETMLIILLCIFVPFL